MATVSTSAPSRELANTSLGQCAPSSTRDGSVERDVERVGAEAGEQRADPGANMSEQRQEHDDADGDDPRGLRSVGVAGEVHSMDQPGRVQRIEPLRPLRQPTVAGESWMLMREDGEQRE